MMEHTERCQQDRVRIEKERQEYAAKWPSYCRTCDGWGGEWFEFDPSPAGISLSPGTLADFEFCPDCLGLEKCARCGEVVSDWGDDEMTCPLCGADFCDINIGISHHECFCRELEAERMMDEAERAIEELRGEDYGRIAD